MSERTQAKNDLPPTLMSESLMVFRLFDELNGITRPSGYKEPWIYKAPFTRDDLAYFTAKLCQRLLDVDVTKYSPELQAWWSDYRAALKRKLLGIEE